jgi:farnesyl diphosphate synthase
MVASQKVPEELVESAEFTQLLLDMGYYFQAEDDWLDVYADPKVTGKIGTDLKDGKVTWLSCRALELCDATQREILIASLGHDEAAARSIYDAVNVNLEYERYESETRERLQARVDQLSEAYPKATITVLLKLLTKRKR